MVLPPYAALDAIHRGRSSFELLNVMAEYAVFSELLAARGHVPGCRALVQRVQRILGHVGVNGASSQYQLPAQGYETLTAWLEFYVEQLGQAGLDGILTAHAALPEFIAERTAEMKAAA